MAVSTKHIPIDGGTIGSVRIHAGADARGVPLVYVNGGPGGTYFDADHGITALSGTRDIVLYDQLCSHHSPAAFDLSLAPMPRFVDELKSVLDAYGFDQAIILGHSFGGSIAADFALAHPGRVAGLILSSPLLSTARWVADANALLERLPEAERELIAARLRGESVPDAAYEAAERLFYDRHLCRLDPWPDRLLESFSETNVEIYRAMWGISEFTCTGTLQDYDCLPHLPELRMPVLMMCGRHDEATPETIGEAASKIPGARFVVIEDASHCALLENRADYLSAIETFAAEVDAKYGGPGQDGPATPADSRYSEKPSPR